jgi:large subunit ribosomal protein L9
MRVILLDDVDNLGEAGDVVNVKGGYARNWLIPQKLADAARPDLLNRLTAIKKRGEERRLARLSEERAIIDSMNGRIVTIYARAGQEGRLFGAVTNATVSDALKSMFNVKLDRKFIKLPTPIKQLGEFPIEMRASSEIKGALTVIVKNEEDKAKDVAEKARLEAEKKAAAEAEKAPEPTEA